MIAETSTAAAEEYFAALAEANLAALWQRVGETTAREPRVGVAPCLWRRAVWYPHLQRATEFVVPGRGGERRVVQFLNPALRERFATTHTLFAGMQMLLPGEVAPAHRHTAAAIRFIAEGSGAYTTVQGERCVMRRHDLVVTPNWTWHDHANVSDEPIIWLDGLDVPLVRGMLQSAFWEPYPADRQPVEREPDAVRQSPPGGLQPVVRGGDAGWPLFLYPWAQARAALDALAATDTSPADDVYLEYTHPGTGGHLMPTIACYLQLLRPGVQTGAHRHTSSAVYYVAEGAGTTTMDDQSFDWEAGDVLALPPWTWHAHANRSASAPAILFSMTDRPLYEALGLYREQTPE
jgi:gentisate 1,2-dioxygenase